MPATLPDMPGVLAAVLEVLREQGHTVDRITLLPTGEIELRLDAGAVGQHTNPLDEWRATKRRRASPERP